MSPDRSLVLVVDDDPLNIPRIKQALDSIAADFEVAANGIEALEVLSRHAHPHGFPGIVVSDLKMPVMDGLEFLSLAVKDDPDLPVILISAYGEIATAVEAMKGGAYDFIERPFDVEDLVAKVGRALDKRQLVLDNRRLRTELANRTGIASRLIGNSPVIQALRDEIVNVGSTDATVLIHGETGTGKEVVARALHEVSRRSRVPLRRDQLRSFVRESHRQRIVRTRARRIHGRQAAPHRPRRVRQGRHAVPRRDREHADQSSGQAPADAPGARHQPARQQRGDQGRYPPRRGDQDRPARCGQAPRVPRGSVFPAWCRGTPHPSAQRAAGGHPAPLPTLRRRVLQPLPARNSAASPAPTSSG